MMDRRGAETADRTPAAGEVAMEQETGILRVRKVLHAGRRPGRPDFGRRLARGGVVGGPLSLREKGEGEGAPPGAAAARCPSPRPSPGGRGGKTAREFSGAVAPA